MNSDARNASVRSVDFEQAQSRRKAFSRVEYTLRLFKRSSLTNVSMSWEWRIQELRAYTSIMNAKPSELTNEALLSAVKRLAEGERRATAVLIAHLAEVERRGIFHAEGCSSMFAYCTEILGLSEHATFLRLRAARAARMCPQVLEDLESAALNLSTLALLEPYLGSPDAGTLIERARGKSKHEVEKLIRARDPLPSVESSVRKLPESRLAAVAAGGAVAVPTGRTIAADFGGAAAVRSGSAAAATSASQVSTPLAPERYKIQFTTTQEVHDQLRRVRNLLRHRIPDGDVGRIFELALAALVEKIEKRKFARTSDGTSVKGGDGARTGSGANGSRTIPAAVRRAVVERDGEQCAFIGANGHRCTSRAFLEFHHLVPFEHGGAASVGNIALRCRAHNQYEARLEFGAFMMHGARG